MIVIGSFLATLAFTTLTVALVAQIDSSLTPFVAAIAVVLIAGAVLIGVAQPDEGIDKFWKRAALSWVTVASRGSFPASAHLALMTIFCVLIYHAGFGSMYSGIHCWDVVSRMPQYRLTWRSVGRDMEATCTEKGGLSAIWLPFAQRDALKLTLTSNGNAFDCSIKADRLDCTVSEIDSDSSYEVETAKQTVDFRKWEHVSLAAVKPTSFVTNTFDLLVKRLAKKKRQVHSLGRDIKSVWSGVSRYEREWCL
jgi:hypothetical protein